MRSSVQAFYDFVYDKKVKKEWQKRNVEEKNKEQQKKKPKEQIDKNAHIDARSILQIVQKVEMLKC